MPSNYKVPINILELDNKSFHLLIEAEINELAVNLIIDTGASKTVFDKSLNGIAVRASDPQDLEEIHSMGIMTGNIESQSAVVKLFKLGKLKLRDFPVVLIDLESINKIYLKVTGKQIHGLLGSDFLLEMNAVIDYGKACLILKKPGS
jgi:predicted aspartyl protease